MGTGSFSSSFSLADLVLSARCCVKCFTRVVVFHLPYRSCISIVQINRRCLHGVSELHKVTQNCDLLDSRAQDLNHNVIWSQGSLYEVEVRGFEEHQLEYKELGPDAMLV